MIKPTLLVNIAQDRESLYLILYMNWTIYKLHYFSFTTPSSKESEEIKPSQVEVAPLHRTFVISYKRRLFKNTKEF